MQRRASCERMNRRVSQTSKCAHTQKELRWGPGSKERWRTVTRRKTTRSISREFQQWMPKGSECQYYSKHTSEDRAILIQELDHPYKGSNLSPPPPTPNARRAASFFIQTQLGKKRKQKQP
ncbi:hypothetical protein mRhiFer1_007966 [Rhinolophus ferrumequinum]|uniref:Uncharacterized protein n=1 Tax=Rhinolophus ferrumequinum TaxID=59479 RepID=A0A7J8AWA6_RHIFE|nr:hypothetical protein mRhiFer1_007966 [Rhinolophus ferrumequinum]